MFDLKRKLLVVVMGSLLLVGVPLGVPLAVYAQKQGDKRPPKKDDNKVVEDIYLACLNRPPTEKEMAAVDLTKASRLEIAQDLAWALLNSPAFLFNR